MKHILLGFRAVFRTEVILVLRTIRFWILCGLSLGFLGALAIGQAGTRGLFREWTGMLSGGGCLIAAVVR